MITKCGSCGAPQKNNNTNICEFCAGSLVSSDINEKTVDEFLLIKYDFLKGEFRKVINKRKRKLKHRKLSEDEQFCVDNLGFSPAICLVFDDCAHALPIANQKKPNFRNLFLAGRHNYITVLIAVHNRANLDKTINSELITFNLCSMCEK